MSVVRCKHCKGAKANINTNFRTGQIFKEPCEYCKGKGYIIQNKKEVI